MPTLLFSWFFGSDSPFWRRYLLGCALALGVMLPTWGYYFEYAYSGRNSDFITAVDSADLVPGRVFPIFDPDGAKWLLLVENSISDGTFGIGSSPVDAVGIAGPDKVYWSSCYFHYLKVLSCGFSFLGYPLAEAVSWAGFLAGPLLLFLGLWPFVWLAMKALPSFWGVLLFPLIFFDRRMESVFSSFYPDHQGLIFLFTCFWILAFFWAWRSSAPKFPLLVSAVCLGISLGLSVLTTIPILAVFGFGVLLSYFFGNCHFDPLLFRKWGAFAAGVSLLLWILDYSPDRLGMRLEVIHPLWALGVLGGCEILCRACCFFMGRRQPPFFGLESPFLGWAVAMVFVFLAPFCIAYTAGGWFWPALPWVSTLMTVISELQPVAFPAILIGGGMALALLVVLFCLLAGKSSVSGFLITGVLPSIFYAFQARWGGDFSLLLLVFPTFGSVRVRSSLWAWPIGIVGFLPACFGWIFRSWTLYLYSEFGFCLQLVQ